jgi:Etoposide-induced protein 2.4 (EI24)
MIKPMGRVADSFWRAAVYCLHPQVIGLSLLPLLVLGLLSGGLGYFFWESAVSAVRATIESWSLVEGLLKWLDSMGGQSLRTVLAPIILLCLTLPPLAALSMVLVAMLMTPSLVNLVGRRRFPSLERKRGGGFFASLMWSLGHTVVCLLLLMFSLPFWLIPPLFAVLPPLIFGWLGYRVFTFDSLADHASGPERRRLLREHRLPLMLLGLCTGYLGAAPAAIFSLGVMAIALTPVLLPLAVWLFTLVFAFSSLWFTHYTLAALQEMRREATVTPSTPLDEVMDALPANYATTPPRVEDFPPDEPVRPEAGGGMPSVPTSEGAGRSGRSAGDLGLPGH